jgi:hypothetical protein
VELFSASTATEAFSTAVPFDVTVTTTPSVCETPTVIPSSPVPANAGAATESKSVTASIGTSVFGFMRSFPPRRSP